MIKFGKAPDKPAATKPVEKPVVEPKPSKAKFDRNAYQREFMRKKRAAAKRMEIAVMMGFSPGHPESWPAETIERLMMQEQHEGRQALLREIRRIMNRL